MDITEIINLKFSQVDLRKDIIIQDDGKGPYIKKWDKSLGPKPDKAMLDAWAREIAPIKEANKVIENRLAEYPKTDDLIIALWEKQVNGDSTEFDTLEAKRQAIKKKHPKK